MAFAALGPIIQIAYVVEDVHDAVAQWARVHHVGPFAVMERVKYDEFECRGVKSQCELSLAFAYSGDVQIELIQQHSTAPTIYLNAAGAPLTGFHHLGVLTRDIVSDEARMIEAGLTRVQRSVAPSGTEVRYYEGGPAGLYELIQLADGGAFFARLKQAAAAWDGVSPYLK